MRFSHSNGFEGVVNHHDSYTYEVCLFDEIKQKPNNGGTTFSLGYETNLPLAVNQLTTSQKIRLMEPID